jgi:BirA family biotin operon repressor/biotin-[acetyl-CoA-carboxylase] ligase
MTDSFDERANVLQQNAVKRDWVGRKVIWKESTTSTNDDCWALAQVGEVGTVVFADVQTHGRGQHGRQWSAPPGLGLLMSMIVPDSRKSAAFLVAWSSISVAEVLEQHAGLQSQVKWPNDVLVAGKKIAGVLVERRSAIVVGIGINVNQSEKDFPSDCPVPPTSVLLQTGSTYDRVRLANHLLAQLDVNGQKTTEELCAQWATRCPLDVGQIISATTRTGTLVGRFQSLRPDVGLTLIPQEAKTPCVIAPENLTKIMPLVLLR